MDTQLFPASLSLAFFSSKHAPLEIDRSNTLEPMFQIIRVQIYDHCEIETVKVNQ